MMMVCPEGPTPSLDLRSRSFARNINVPLAVGSRSRVPDTHARVSGATLTLLRLPFIRSLGWRMVSAAAPAHTPFFCFW
jgi:hypothetical protein